MGGDVVTPPVSAVDVTCPVCKAAPGERCKDRLSPYAALPYLHWARRYRAAEANDKGKLPL